MRPHHSWFISSNALKLASKFIAFSAALAWASTSFGAQNQCSATSGPTITPVLELYTSEGCSSCPPADQWASTFKEKNKDSAVVVQAFHVGYWDYIGWVDRFAAPAYTNRQREIGMRESLRSVYTPQAVLNGKDWPRWSVGSPASVVQGAATATARTRISLQQLGPDQFEASVTPVAVPGSPATAASWSAYWTVTEHGHNSKVKAGENAGEFLKHDFVVRQYTPAGEYKTTSNEQKLAFRSIALTPDHPRQVNLVVFDTKTGATLQALSLQCAV
ncbi:MAG: DUF1223 domain-containing protein [Polaromonas sp.]|nr:DUF1223 domain-containing protein [Polaromonas sp.]